MLTSFSITFGPCNWWNQSSSSKQWWWVAWGRWIIVAACRMCFRFFTFTRKRAVVIGFFFCSFSSLLLSPFSGFSMVTFLKQFYIIFALHWAIALCINLLLVVHFMLDVFYFDLCLHSDWFCSALGLHFFNQTSQVSLYVPTFWRACCASLCCILRPHFLRSLLWS